MIADYRLPLEQRLNQLRLELVRGGLVSPVQDACQCVGQALIRLRILESRVEDRKLKWFAAGFLSSAAITLVLMVLN